MAMISSSMGMLNFPTNNGQPRSKTPVTTVGTSIERGANQDSLPRAASCHHRPLHPGQGEQDSGDILNCSGRDRTAVAGRGSQVFQHQKGISVLTFELGAVAVGGIDGGLVGQPLIEPDLALEESHRRQLPPGNRVIGQELEDDTSRNIWLLAVEMNTKQPTGDASFAGQRFAAAIPDLRATELISKHRGEELGGQVC